MIKLPRKAQTVFNKVARHLLTQKERCANSDNCLYRSKNGLKCAAGCLIPDEQYEAIKDKEGKNWRHLVLHRLVSSSHMNLIELLQDTHDDDSPEEWKQSLCRIATKFGLNTKILDKFD